MNQPITVTLCEEDRQLTLLALSRTALLHPGFDFALTLIAKQLAGEEMYQDFKRLNEDRIKPQ